jgi:purine-nucleoside/S-methyl-5'-thioadenosine phosphorylase / adenosine deaminase
MRWRENDSTRWLEADLDGARAVFTTRLGGVSSAPFETLNLGLLTGDDRDAVTRNRQIACAAAGIEPANVLSGHQVHGAELQLRDAPPDPNGFSRPGTPLADADGQLTGTPGLAPLVLVADCLPIALAGTGAVAMLHCGWRGLAGGIVDRGVAASGATRAAIGPGVGACCYEVGEEVLAEFEPLGEGIAAGRMLDLGEVARRLLRKAGVGDIDSAELCTSCHPELLYSHRRDGERSGRQAGLVWLKA